MTEDPHDNDKRLNDILEKCAEPDWDGYGAAPVNVEAVKLARRIIELVLSVNPVVVPNSDGTVDIEWDITEEDGLFLNCKDETELLAEFVKKEELNDV